jgi:hypothetical protein
MSELEIFYEVIYWCINIPNNYFVPQYIVEYCTSIQSYTFTEYFDNNIEDYINWYEQQNLKYSR